MLYASTTNALESRHQSVFNLELSQSKSGDNESNFGKEVAWLYESSNTEEVTEEKSAVPLKSSTPQSKKSIPTDCLFFDQFISLHQPTLSFNDASAKQIEHRVQVNTYLNELIEST
jgi:hypothetical protein